MKEIIAGNSKQTEYPLLGHRVQSSFIDLILLVILMLVFGSILDRYENVPDWVRIGLFFCLWAAYEPVCTSIGCTVGNYIKGIRVRQQHSTTKRINIIQALIRYVIQIALGWVSFLTIHSTDERRAIHDFASGSVMIKI